MKAVTLALAFAAPALAQDTQEVSRKTHPYPRPTTLPQPNSCADERQCPIGYECVKVGEESKQCQLSAEASAVSVLPGAPHEGDLDWTNWHDAYRNADAYDDYADSFHPIFTNVESPAQGMLYSRSFGRWGSLLRDQVARAQKKGDEEETKSLTYALTANNQFKLGADLGVLGREGAGLMDTLGWGTLAQKSAEELRNAQGEERRNAQLEYNVYNSKSMGSYFNSRENEDLGTALFYNAAVSEVQIKQIEMDEAQREFNEDPSYKNRLELELASLSLQAAQAEVSAGTTELFPGIFEELLGGKLGALYTFKKWALTAQIQRAREQIAAAEFEEATGRSPYTMILNNGVFEPYARLQQQQPRAVLGQMSLYGTRF